MRGPQTYTGHRAWHPVTGKVTRVANSKIVRTFGSDLVRANNIPITVCTNYLRGHCSLGNGCLYLHVVGVSPQVWPLVQLPIEALSDADWCNGEEFHEAGWSLRAYDASLSYLVEVPSHQTLRTRGSVAVAVQYNNKGPCGRYYASLCPEYSATRSCVRRGMCPDIHFVGDVTSMPRSVVHVNYESLESPSTANYATLPPGRTLRVVDPNVRTNITEVASEQVLRTVGSERYYESGRGCLTHCAHFYLSKLCRRGPNCYFTHVLHIAAPHKQHIIKDSSITQLMHDPIFSGRHE